MQSLHLNFNNKDIVEALKRIKRLGCNAMIVLDRSEMTNHFANIGIIDTCEEDIEESQVRRFCTIATQAQIKKNKNYYVVRNAGCTRSRYTLKLSLIFLINQSMSADP